MQYYLAIEWNYTLITVYSMDEPWMHAKGKKPVTEDHVWYEFISMKCSE